MKIKDLPLISVLGDAFKIPISDITSDRALAVTLGQILKYVEENFEGDVIEEAPDDGKTYGRKNKAWSEVTGGGSGVKTVECTLSEYKAMSSHDSDTYYLITNVNEDAEAEDI